MNKSVLIVFILFVFKTYSQASLDSLFFSLPLQSSRDTIYSSIGSLGFQNLEKFRVPRNDTVVKTFYGYKNNLSSDSIGVQLSSGTVQENSNNFYNRSIIITCYYHFSKLKEAKEFYQKRKREIAEIMKYKSLHYKCLSEKKRTGFGDRWFNSLNDPEVSIEFIKKIDQYIVEQQYFRIENKKKYVRNGNDLDNRKRKELVYRDLKSEDIFQYYNVDKVPVIKKCEPIEESSYNCLLSNIVRQIPNTIKIDDINLEPGTYTILTNFVIDKSGKIININVSFKNEKLSNRLKSIINNIIIEEPAKLNDKAVNFSMKFPIQIII